MVDPALLDYINKSKGAHLTPEQIVQNLLQAGWPELAIQQALIQIINSPRPSASNLQKNKFTRMFSRENIIYNSPEILLQVGLAFVFLYAAFYISNDESGAKFVPNFVTNFIPSTTFLNFFGIFEILLAIWLLSGFLIKYAALLSAALLLAITLFNLTYISVLFRNVAIICAALALFSLKMLPDRKK